MKHIIIGIREEVGKQVHGYLRSEEGAVVSGIDRWDRVVEGEYLNECVRGDEFDEMHICVPYFNAEGYVKEVRYYMDTYPSKKIVLHSEGVPREVWDDLNMWGYVVVWFKIPKIVC